WLCVLSLLQIVLFLWLVFFVQAGDGIRDRNVTGVQTCALPIYVCLATEINYYSFLEASMDITVSKNIVFGTTEKERLTADIYRRSEERRVGKECRCRCSPG